MSLIVVKGKNKNNDQCDCACTDRPVMIVSEESYIRMLQHENALLRAALLPKSNKFLFLKIWNKLLFRVRLKFSKNHSETLN